MKCIGVLVIIFIHSSAGVFENKILETINNARSNSRMSDQCSDALASYLENLNTTTDDKWALKMLDATSKIPVGLLFSFNLGEMGEFDQCLDTESQDGLIKAKYCLGSISLDSNSFNINKNDLSLLRKQIRLREAGGRITNIQVREGNGATTGISPTWAICLPSNCTDEDVAQILHELIGSPGASCQTKEDLSPPLTNGAIVTIAVLAYFAALLVLSTICDLYYNFIKKEPPYEILVAFSVYKNGKKLFKTSKNSAELSCLNGIKLLSMLWVIIGHLYSAQTNGFPLSNYKDMLTWADSLHSMIIVSGTLSVDTFFLVGGLLVVYGFMKAKYNGVKFNIFFFYLHRYLRLTPVLAMTVLFTSYLLNYMGSGPRWNLLENSFQRICKKYWWSTLLYVQNYANDDGETCVGQTWYLSVDMQLYVLSPLILLPLWRYPKLGVALVVSLILAFIIIPFYVAYDLELTGLLTNFYVRPGHENDFMYKYYTKTHTRAAPWIIGALLGYVLAKIRFSKEKNWQTIKIGKPIVFLLWAICIAVTFTCIYGGHSTLRGEDYDRWGNAFYIGLMRPAWSVCLVWVILACVIGYGGPINLMLSLPIYQVLNRFTYSTYLLHLSIIYMIAVYSRRAAYFSDFNMAYSFWGVTMFSFGLSILWVLAFESPMIAIEKLIFKGINLAISKILIHLGRRESKNRELCA